MAAVMSQWNLTISATDRRLTRRTDWLGKLRKLLNLLGRILVAIELASDHYTRSCHFFWPQPLAILGMHTGVVWRYQSVYLYQSNDVNMSQSAYVCAKIIRVEGQEQAFSVNVACRKCWERAGCPRAWTHYTNRWKPIRHPPIKPQLPVKT